jgi:hypothetical protein
LYREAIAIGEKTLGRDHPTVAMRFSNFAVFLADKRDYDGAAKLLEESIRILRKVYGNDHPNIAGKLNNLAGVLMTKGKVQCFGYNRYGQTGSGNTTSPMTTAVDFDDATEVFEVAAGYVHTCVSFNGGPNVKCLGFSNAGCIGNPAASRPQLALIDFLLPTSTPTHSPTESPASSKPSKSPFSSPSTSSPSRSQDDPNETLNGLLMKKLSQKLKFDFDSNLSIDSSSSLMREL